MSADALLPAPEVVRCRGCHRVCRHGTVQGYGPRCAAERGLIPPRVRVPRPRGETADGPDLFNHEEINEGDKMTNHNEVEGNRWRRIAQREYDKGSWAQAAAAASLATACFAAASVPREVKFAAGTWPQTTENSGPEGQHDQ